MINIVLTGFMGTGKTAVGRVLAKMLNYDFVDTDELIEVRDGRSIPAIFAESGEVAFRQLERDVALELAGRQRLVISTGGRLMLDPVNTAVLMRKGRVFCLTASPEEILARVSGGGGEERPLLAGSDPAKTIAELLEKRREGYGQYEQVATTGKRPEQVAKILYKMVQGEIR